MYSYLPSNLKTGFSILKNMYSNSCVQILKLQIVDFSYTHTLCNHSVLYLPKYIQNQTTCLFSSHLPIQSSWKTVYLAIILQETANRNLTFRSFPICVKPTECSSWPCTWPTHHLTQTQWELTTIQYSIKHPCSWARISNTHLAGLGQWERLFLEKRTVETIL